MNAYVEYGMPRGVLDAVNALHRELEAAYGGEVEFLVANHGRMVACSNLGCALAGSASPLDTRGAVRAM